MHEIERHERVRGDIEVEHPRRQELRVIDLRPARPEVHLKPVLLVDAGRDRLIKPAMLGFGLPVGAEIDRFGRAGARQHQRGA